jgi:hypothetical protein
MIMGGGLKQQLGVDDPAKAGSDKQSKDFQTAFEKELTVINGHLQYTSANADVARHEPLATRRDALTTSFQSALALVDPANAGKAKGAIDKVLTNARGLNADVAKFRKEAEKAANDWKLRQPKLDDGVHQVEELEAWEDPKAAILRGLVDGIRKLTDDRKYTQACSTLDQFLPKLKPIHEEYLKQKEAKQNYDLGLPMLEPKITATTLSHYTKLEQKQKDIDTSKKDMEAAAKKKNFVGALQMLADLETEVKAYEEALAELDAKKQEYTSARADVQRKLSSEMGTPHVKLEPMKNELDSIHKEMETAAKAEDFALATQFGKDLSGKVDAYKTALVELEAEKKAYEDALAPLKPRLDKLSTCDKDSKKGPLQGEITLTQSDMQKAADSEDYTRAASTVKNLEAVLTAYESVDANKMYVVEYPKGTKYYVTAEELAVLKLKASRTAIEKVLPSLKIKAESYTNWYHDLKSLADSHYVIATVVNFLGGATLESAGEAAANQQPALDELANAISTNPANIEAAYQKAIDAINATGRHISAYMDAIDRGGKTTITMLETVAVVCFAVAAALGGAALVEAGVIASSVGANAVAGAGFGALQSVTENAAAPAVWGDANKINVQEVVTKAAYAAVVNGAGAALGSAASKQLSGLVLKQVAARYAMQEATQKVVAKMIDGGISNTVQAAVTASPDLIRGKTTWDQFAVVIAEAMIAGMIGGFLSGKFGKKAPELKGIPEGDVDAAVKELQAGKGTQTPPQLGDIKQAKQNQHSYAMSPQNENAGTQKSLNKPSTEQQMKDGKGDPNSRIDKLLKVQDGRTPGASLLNEKYGGPSGQGVVRQKVQAELNAGRYGELKGGGKQLVVDMGEPTGWTVDKDLNSQAVQKLRVDIDKNGAWHFFPTQ